MKKTEIFDVLVVYSQDIAISASETQSTTPFELNSEYANYNASYSYFLEQCELQGIHAALASSKDIVDTGKVSAYWLFKKGRWEKHTENAYAEFIFDKFTPKNPRQKAKKELLFSDPNIKTLTNLRLITLFTDKLSTYQNLSEYTLPTVAIEDKTTDGVAEAVRELRELTIHHSHSTDFGPQIILKDRFGAGGVRIFKIEKNFVKEITKLVNLHKHINFIIQPFLLCDLGVYEQYTGFIDFRYIYFGNNLLQSYIRIAKKGDFRCNEHQGGDLIYLNTTQLPKDMTAVAKKIVKTINFPNSLFALDFMRSNSGNIYMIEGNSTPGIDWNEKKQENELKTKKLIRYIIDEIAQRISAVHMVSHKPIIVNKADIKKVTPTKLSVEKRETSKDQLVH